LLARLVETKSELVDLKIKVEAERQRNLKRISVAEGEYIFREMGLGEGGIYIFV